MSNLYADDCTQAIRISRATRALALTTADWRGLGNQSQDPLKGLHDNDHVYASIIISENDLSNLLRTPPGKIYENDATILAQSFHSYLMETYAELPPKGKFDTTVKAKLKSGDDGLEVHMSICTNAGSLRSAMERMQHHIAVAATSPVDYKASVLQTEKLAREVRPTTGWTMQ